MTTERNPTLLICSVIAATAIVTGIIVMGIVEFNQQAEARREQKLNNDITAFKMDCAINMGAFGGTIHTINVKTGEVRTELTCVKKS